MTISLYDVSVGRYLQTLGAVAGFLERGRAHCAEAGVDPDTLVGARLTDDMLPLSFQIQSVVHHSRGTIEGARSGQFTPPSGDLAKTYAEMQERVADAIAALQGLTVDEVNGLASGEIVFQLGSMSMPFTVEGFVLSFSLPNFYFHAATAYDLLRLKGVPLGKRNFMGQMMLKA